MGTLSYGLIGVPQLAQWLAGKTIDSSRGYRWMTTFRKLPTMAPSANAMAAMKDSTRREYEVKAKNSEWGGGVLHAAHQMEANGVWWPPRSSKPLFRRGSVERLVRFRHASANQVSG